MGLVELSRSRQHTLNPFSRVPTDFMIKIEIIEPNGTMNTVYGRPGWSLMETALRSGIDGIVAECGGVCGCATCHVLIDPAWMKTVGEPNEMEDPLLDLVDRTPTSRLSCQIKLRDELEGLVVRVADHQI
jgi:2Fe-2S ferredoxin